MLRRSNAFHRCILGLIGLLMLFSVARPNAVRAAVTLVDMTATAQDNKILVKWETATELDTAAFRLYRAQATSGPWNNLIYQQAAQGDGTSGDTYTFADSSITQGVTYYYLLEEVSQNGTPNKLEDFIRSATVFAPNQPTFTPTPTSTATSTATVGPSPTPTSTRTPLPTATDPPTDVPTATRQFANTPLPGNTSTPAATLPPGQPTATRTAGSPTATPIASPQLATPTRLPGAVAPVAPPAAPQPAVTASPVAATATRTPTRIPTATPTAVARTPSATPSPAVFVANATAELVLRGTPARATAPAPTQSDDGRNEGLALAIGGGAVLLAGLLGGAAFIIWRRRRS